MSNCIENWGHPEALGATHKKKKKCRRDIKSEGEKKSYEDGIHFSLRENGRKWVRAHFYLSLLLHWSCSFQSWKLTNKKNLVLDNSPLRSCGALVGLCLPKVLLPLMECVALAGCIVSLSTTCSGHGALTVSSSVSLSRFRLLCSVDIHRET